MGGGMSYSSYADFPLTPQFSEQPFFLSELYPEARTSLVQISRITFCQGQAGIGASRCPICCLWRASGKAILPYTNFPSVLLFQFHVLHPSLLYPLPEFYGRNRLCFCTNLHAVLLLESI